MCTKDDVIRVKKGMVFWCDMDPTIDKLNVPYLNNEKGVSVKDRVLYGRRPWMVVSNNGNNQIDTLCTVVPFSQSCDPSLPYHIPIKVFSESSTICVEQIRTVNCQMLVNYFCTVSDEVLEKVESVIAKYFGLPVQNLWQGIGIKDALDRVEALIGGIIDREKSKRAFSEEDIEFLVKGVLEKLNKEENADFGLDNVQVGSLTKQASVTEQVQSNKAIDIDLNNDRVKSFYSKYPEVYQKDVEKGYVPYTSKDGNKSVKQNWTIEKCREFLDDCGRMTVVDIIKKWGFKDRKAFYQRRYYCKNLLKSKDIPSENPV